MSPSFLDNLLGPEAKARLKDLTKDRASLATGAAAGGVLALLLSGGRPGRLIGNAVRLGGTALIGGMAWRAWQDWQAGKAPGADTDSGAAPAALSPPSAAFTPNESHRIEALEMKLVRAMVAAAKADGTVTEEERSRISAHLPELGLGPDTARLIGEELDTPLDAGRIAAMAASPEEGAQIYAASLLAVDPSAPAEKGYLALLAARLGLDPALVAHLHAAADRPVSL